MSKWDYGSVLFCPGCGSEDVSYIFAVDLHRCNACKRAWEINEDDDPITANGASRAKPADKNPAGGA